MTSGAKREWAISKSLLITIMLTALLAGLNYVVINESQKVFATTQHTNDNEEEAEENPYKQIKDTTTTPASIFLENIFKKETNLNSPTLNTTGTPNSPFSWVCDYTPSPAPVMSSAATHTKEKLGVIVQVFGAGQGMLALDNARNKIGACPSKDGIGGIYAYGSPVSDTQGFVATHAGSNGGRSYTGFFALGDTLFSVTHKNPQKVYEYSAIYAKLAKELLAPVCLNISFEKGDATRNPYHNYNAYTGWEKGRKVTLNLKKPSSLAPGVLSTSKETKGHSIPVGKFNDEKTLANGEIGETLDIPYASLPDRPLDPVPVEVKMEQPTLLDLPAPPPTPETTATVPERVEDLEGPGCGWAFTKQFPPKYDASEEKKRADKAASKKQEELVKNYEKFLTQWDTYLNDYRKYAESIQQYRKYAKEVDKVAEEWRFVNEERAKYRFLLDEYLAAKATYDKFIEDYEAALKSFEEEVEKCEAEEDTTDTPTPEDPDPSASPDEDEEGTSEDDEEEETIDCSAIERPSILDETPPEEPTPPSKPTGVTLPYAWDDDIPGEDD